jgi:two-component system chemotaxis response regulator CheY
MKSLVAEDDQISRKVLQNMLQCYGPCKTVADGAQAVEAFEQAWEQDSPYDLVCLDIMMPVIDGQEALKRIRQVESRMGLTSAGKTKVIMLSALEDPSVLMEAFYRGDATAYMVKPIEIHALEVELQNLELPITRRQMGWK